MSLLSASWFIVSFECVIVALWIYAHVRSQQVRVKVGAHGSAEILQAPKQLTKVEGREVVMYYLRNSKK